MYFINPHLKVFERVFDENNRKDYLRLDLNENPGGLPGYIVRSVLDSVTPEMIAQYPETMPLMKTLADYLKVSKENICLTNGSAEGIRYIIEAFSSEGGEIVGVTPSYMMFSIYSKMYGRKFIKVPYRNDLTMNINDLLDALSPSTQILILLNPNNPMGNVYSDDEMAMLVDRCQQLEITIIIDEAYYYFYPKTFIKYAINNRHIFITRTFSKLFSMAGCRLGYVIGNQADIAMIRKLTTPHNTNVFALLFAEQIIKSPELIQQLIDEFNKGREFLIKELEKSDYQYTGEAGNFIFIKPKSDAEQLVKDMRQKKGILIKSYEDVGDFGNCLRVTIGGEKYMRVFVAALKELDR